MTRGWEEQGGTGLPAGPDSPGGLSHARRHARAGAILVKLGRIAEGIASYEEALVHQADFPEACNNLAHAWLRQGEVAKAVAACRQALALRPVYPKAHSNLLFALHCEDFDPRELFAEHKRWAERNEPRRAHRHFNDPSPERRLRIGYVSAAFGRGHPVSAFLEPVLRHHDGRAFEVTCYSCAPDRDGRLRSLGPRWRNIHGKPDSEAAQRVRRDRIDILVDLDGHSAGNRLTLLARKPAPVQVTWLGYADTTGLKSMDYRITDRHADPPGMTEHLHTERLVRLPGGFLCYQPPEEAPQVTELPARRAGAFTFGSFNHPVKLSRRVVETWAAILWRVPRSRLLLHHCDWDIGDIRARAIEQFRGAGIGADRLEFAGRIPDLRAHLEVFGRADIGLDTFPYNGTSTTCEALWMGLPVVTLAGATHVSRAGASLLCGLGLECFVAATADRYADLAVRAASDLGGLQSLRAGLRSRMASATLTDAAGFTRRLENAYRRMWRRWSAKRT